MIRVSEKQTQILRCAQDDTSFGKQKSSSKDGISGLWSFRKFVPPAEKRRWCWFCSIDERVGEEEIPGTVEVEPALSAEPAGGQGRNVEEGVASHADHLGAVPAEEGARGQAHCGWIGDAAEADRASFALIGDGPAESEETDGEAPEELEALGER